MQKSKIKKGDMVIVITGKDKGQKGQVLAVSRRKERFSDAISVLVEGVNLVKKHTKPIPAQNKEGGIIEKEKHIDISNVAILNKSTGKRDRVQYRILEDGRKVRIYKSTGEEIDV